MQIKKSGKIHYLEPRQLATAGISVQGFTTRHEGVSRPPYNSLNLGFSTLDASHNVEGNRSILTRAFGAWLENLVTVTQVHGTDLLVLDEPNQDFSHFQKLECDGIITNQPWVMIGVCVADCVPVLLLDPARKVIAALHAGWKGTAQGIVKKGVAAMVRLFECDPDNILAAIGPAIGACCYEVDAPVAEEFRKNGLTFESFAEESSPGKWRLNLVAANHHQLLQAGLLEKNLETSSYCVSCEKDLFFSYRRDNGETGRQMGFIMLKGKKRQD
ncbi:MAG TPA: peptidoglycan editing factor PgeF [Geobacteraceae bacterium]|nr:peptidoglycan editing factor PgeF [Geobacteraceae bacterium]